MDSDRELELFKAGLMRDLEQLKANLQFDMQKQLQQSKANHEQQHGMRSAQIDFGMAAIRGVTLANGGAAVALLTFLGHVWKEGGVGHAVAAQMANAMLSFVFGVGFGVFAASLSYLSQTVYVETEQNWLGQGFRIGAATSVFVGIFLFGWGAFQAVVRLVPP